MRFNLVESGNERRLAIAEETEYTKEIVTNILFLSSVKEGDLKYKVAEEDGFDSANIELKLMANGIEIDLEKGLERFVKLLNG